MNITLNGKTQALENVNTVTDLINFLGYQDKRIAVERNGEIVPKSQHGTETIADQDSIEIVVAVGGG